MNRACILLLALAGCAAPKPDVAPAPPAPEPAVEAKEPCPEAPVNTEIRWLEITRNSELEKLLLYFEGVRDLPAPDLAREYEQRKQNFSSERSEYLRMQLALLASLPNTGFRDEARALNLLEYFLKDESATPGLRAFAVYLNSTIQEQKKTDEAAKAAAQRVKDEQRRIESVEARLRDEQRRNDELEKKLEALKAIEKSLMEREAPAQRK
ncbi:MAG: hypothetical protein ACREV9_02745 [Burkholderiales bacterium]